MRPRLDVIKGAKTRVVGRSYAVEMSRIVYIYWQMVLMKMMKEMKKMTMMMTACCR